MFDNDTNFSIESLIHDGIMTLSTNNASYEDRQLLDELGIESLVQDQEFDSEKNAFYMHKTMEALEESNRLRDYAIMSINAVNHTRSVLERVSQEHRLNLDVNKISYEGKLRDFINKSIKVIQASMKKFIEAIVVFIKNIQNTVKNVLQKNQAKWYAKNKAAVTTALADPSNQAKVQTDFFFSENSNASNNSLGPKLMDCSGKLRYTYDQQLSLSKTKVEQLLIKTVDLLEKAVPLVEEEAMSAKHAADTVLSNAEKLYDEFEHGNTGSPKDKSVMNKQYIQDKLYGTDKPVKKEVLVNKLVTQGDLDNLGTPSSDFIKNLNDIADKMAKDLKEMINGTIAKKITEIKDIIGGKVSEKNLPKVERIAQRGLKSMTSGIQKEYSQVFQAKVFLFSNYLKYRSLIFTAAQRLISSQSSG